MKKKNQYKFVGGIVAVAVLLAIYFLTPVNEYLSVDKVTELTSDVPENMSTALIFLGLFFIGGAILIPIPLMAFAVTMVFDVGISLLICLPGFLIASLSGYLVGRLIGTDGFGETISHHINNIRHKVDDKGAWALLALRLAPTPPFTVTSIIAGSMSLNVWKYALGSMAGIAPLGLSAIFFGKGALEMMKEPSALAALSIVAAVMLYGLYRVIKHQQTQNA
ncbi:TVP38/TMEM64 family protein [Neptunicella marina]|uniref:TVP38/TMEM64 family membrane protein n=1 Tax=Neptunicella marina TaxID=2125989 RepID=A0A8J6LX03_9ALTE|nr:VTT domain-containing protein [Neptunicella marina]MBC3764495.1 VTT domain-containing protein [Neptunicella marina]